MTDDGKLLGQIMASCARLETRTEGTANEVLGVRESVRRLDVKVDGLVDRVHAVEKDEITGQHDVAALRERIHEQSESRMWKRRTMTTWGLQLAAALAIGVVSWGASCAVNRAARVSPPIVAPASAGAAH